VRPPRASLAAALALGLLPGTPAPAAEPANDAALAKAIAHRDQWRSSRAAMLRDDFGELARYRQANAALGPPAAGARRVIFYGDSITDMWPLAAAFPGKPYVNRGISGQTTAQMLVRFRQDVIDLHPAAVVILAGTNDIAGNTGPISPEGIQANFESIAELARAHGIRVVLASIIPVHNYTPRSELSFPLRPPATIAILDRWLRRYCEANGHVYLDYFSAMVDAKGLLRRELSEDGLHPGAAGYALVAPLADKAIALALAAPAH